MSPATISRPFTNGVYCPIATPFVDGTEELDIKAWSTQVLRLAKAGMGLVIMGTNGEANHLSDEERSQLVSSARQVLDKNGFESLPLLVGTGTGSSHQTIKLCHQAKAAGADYTIVIHPGYFNYWLNKDRKAVKEFFLDVCDKSPLPVMLYNFPGAASGIDLDSDLIIELSEHPNCMGVKGQRIARHTSTQEYLTRHGSQFFVLPGLVDYLLPSIIARQHGCITGTGNIIPKTIVKLWKISNEALETGDVEKLREAQALQDLCSDADWVTIKTSIPGTKYALDHFVQKGLGGTSRKPLPPADDKMKQLIEKEFAEAWAYEQSLP
ncbi:hypothetical protein OIO90_000564 [Microbotryomycetes sp. JL221]|nr:hypothetical protein OIO90_000564 [Microbotryomycetes sp. JL221]